MNENHTWMDTVSNIWIWKDSKVVAQLYESESLMDWSYRKLVLQLTFLKVRFVIGNLWKVQDHILIVFISISLIIHPVVEISPQQLIFKRTIKTQSGDISLMANIIFQDFWEFLFLNPLFSLKFSHFQGRIKRFRVSFNFQMTFI